MDKKALRSAIRGQKRAMTQQQIAEASFALQELFFQTEQYAAAKTIYGYMPYNQEVRTEGILERALNDGKRVAVPKVYGDEMKFIYITDITDMEKSAFGIPEPKNDVPVASDPTALVLMPGLAFDPQGHRIGYGGGFYDRFLSHEPEHPTVALCYGFQMFPQLETDDFDIPVDLVIWVNT